jgi:hypothetical protein
LSWTGPVDVPRTIHTAQDTPMFRAWDGGKWPAWSGQAQLPTSANPFERLIVAYTAPPGDAVIVALNRADSDKETTNLPAGTYVNLVTGATVTASITIPPRSAVILAAL